MLAYDEVTESWNRDLQEAITDAAEHTLGDYECDEVLGEDVDKEGDENNESTGDHEDAGTSPVEDGSYNDAAEEEDCELRGCSISLLADCVMTQFE